MRFLNQFKTLRKDLRNGKDHKLHQQQRSIRKAFSLQFFFQNKACFSLLDKDSAKLQMFVTERTS